MAEQAADEQAAQRAAEGQHQQQAQAFGVERVGGGVHALDPLAVAHHERVDPGLEGDAVVLVLLGEALLGGGLRRHLGAEARRLGAVLPEGRRIRHHHLEQREVGGRHGRAPFRQQGIDRRQVADDLGGIFPGGLVVGGGIDPTGFQCRIGGEAIELGREQGVLGGISRSLHRVVERPQCIEADARDHEGHQAGGADQSEKFAADLHARARPNLVSATMPVDRQHDG